MLLPPAVLLALIAPKRRHPKVTKGQIIFFKKNLNLKNIEDLKILGFETEFKEANKN
jgi:hypothetical protein